MGRLLGHREDLQLGTSAAIEFGTSTSQAIQLLSDTRTDGPRIFTVRTDQDCHLRQGDSTVSADSGDFLLLADSTVTISVTSDLHGYLAVIGSSTPGTLRVTVGSSAVDIEADTIEAPAELVTSGLVAHWDPSDIDNITFSGGGSGDGDQIATITDLIGDSDWAGSNAFVTWDEDGQAEQGLGAAAFASGGKMDFDVTPADSLNPLSGSNEGEIFAALKVTRSAGADNGIWTISQIERSPASLHPAAAGTLKHAFGSSAHKSFSITTPADVRSWHVLNMYSADGDWACYINDVLEHQTGTNTVEWTTGTTSWLLGRSASGSVKFFIGLFGEIALYNRKLSAIERSQVNRYLMNKWGIS